MASQPVPVPYPAPRRRPSGGADRLLPKPAWSSGAIGPTRTKRRFRERVPSRPHAYVPLSWDYLFVTDPVRVKGPGGAPSATQPAGSAAHGRRGPPDLWTRTPEILGETSGALPHHHTLRGIQPRVRSGRAAAPRTCGDAAPAGTDSAKPDAPAPRSPSRPPRLPRAGRAGTTARVLCRRGTGRLHQLRGRCPKPGYPKETSGAAAVCGLPNRREQVAVPVRARGSPDGRACAGSGRFRRVRGYGPQ